MDFYTSIWGGWWVRSKPDSWDDRERIPDEAATKPEDWDEEVMRMTDEDEVVA